MRKFATQPEFLDAVEGEWRGRSCATDVREALRAGLAEAEVALRDSRPEADGGLNLRLNGWLLRSEDLPVVEAIGIVGAAATAAAGPGGLAAGAVITAVSAFAALCWKAWRKGAPLSRPEIAVLGFLQVHGPMDLPQLKKTAAAELEGLSPSEVGKVLQSLTEVELRDGSVVELVRKDASGRWRASAA